MPRSTKRANLVVDRAEGQRWEAGLEMVPQGARLLINDLLLYLDTGKNARPSPDAPLVVEADASRWWHRTLQAEREHKAREQLSRARDYIRDLLGKSSTMTALVRGRSIRYELVDDYGDGAVLLGTLVGDNFAPPSDKRFRP